MSIHTIHSRVRKLSVPAPLALAGLASALLISACGGSAGKGPAVSAAPAASSSEPVAKTPVQRHHATHRATVHIRARALSAAGSATGTTAGGTQGRHAKAARSGPAVTTAVPSRGTEPEPKPAPRPEPAARTKPARKPTPAREPMPVPEHKPMAQSSEGSAIPQGNGGDADADNNGAPSDSDGNL
jgi:hypothetical protein